MKTLSLDMATQISVIFRGRNSKDVVPAIFNTINELEDYLLSQDAAFLTRMRQARAHHLKGETRSLDTLKHEHGSAVPHRVRPHRHKSCN